MKVESTGEVNTRAVSVAAADLSIERPALYVVATPIGNLGDFGARAASVLASVDQILSEDTRRSGRLLEHYGISTPLRAYHDHNETRVAAALVADMLNAKHTYALISDAGTPLISDPGFVLVRAAAAADIPVITIPGPCALTAALSISGLPTDRFVFEGFLPVQAGPRDQRLQAIRGETATLVFYEAPHRLEKTLAAMQLAFGPDRQAVIARELTKRHETVYRGELGLLAIRIHNEAHAGRGEFVILIAGASQAAPSADLEHLLDVLLTATDRKTAVRVAAELSGYGRNEVYRRVLARSQGASPVVKSDKNSHTGD